MVTHSVVARRPTAGGGDDGGPYADSIGPSTQRSNARMQVMPSSLLSGLRFRGSTLRGHQPCEASDHKQQ